MSRAGQVRGIVLQHAPAAEARTVAAVARHGPTELQAEGTGTTPGLFRVNGAGPSGLDAGGGSDTLSVDGNPVDAAGAGMEGIGTDAVRGDALDQFVVIGWQVVSVIPVEANSYTRTRNEPGSAVVAVHVFVDRSADGVGDHEAGDRRPGAPLPGCIDCRNAPVERTEWPS